MVKDSSKTEVYLNYLEKELTIMGILSSFCIVALGFAANFLLGKDGNGTYADKGFFYCCAGICAFLLAAFCFYRQRALLAWYYGQISLSISMDETAQVKKLSENSDDWDNWIWYQFGFLFLAVGVPQFLLVLFSSRCGFLQNHQLLVITILPFVCSIPSFYIIWAYRKFPTSEKPLQELRKHFL